MLRVPFSAKTPYPTAFLPFRRLFEAARKVRFEGADPAVLDAPLRSCGVLANLAASPVGVAVRDAAAQLLSDDLGDLDRILYHNGVVDDGGWWVMAWIFVPDADVSDAIPWPPAGKPCEKLTRQECVNILAAELLSPRRGETLRALRERVRALFAGQWPDGSSSLPEWPVPHVVEALLSLEDSAHVD